MNDVLPPLAGPVLDHVVVNVMEGLDAAFHTFERLGFLLTPRGYHSLGSVNHLAVFETDYLELLGYEAGKQGNRAELWRHPPGLTGLVFKGDQLDARHAELQRRGVYVDAPNEFTRPVSLPEGSRDAHFRVMRTAPQDVQNGRTFFCHHFTPELVWRPQWQAHPNRATAILEFVIATQDPARTSAIYDRMFGPDLLTPVAGGVSFSAGVPTVSILTPDAIAARFGIAPELGPDGSDHMVALVFKTAAPEETRAVLAGNGVPFAPYAGGIVVAPEHAAGVIAAFAPA